MNMKPTRQPYRLSPGYCTWTLLMLTSLALLLPPALLAATRTKQNNTSNLNLAASWDILPGADDVALWNSTVTGANSVQLGADLFWSGIRIENPGGGVNLGTGNNLTLGTNGLDMSTATQNLTVNCDLTLRGRQSWKVPNGRAVYLTGVFNHRGAVVDLTACATNAAMGSLGMDASLIVGPWAIFASGTLLYYAKPTPMLTPAGFTTATAGTLANVGSSTVNFNFAGSATLSTNIIGNTLRYSGASATLANAGKSITLNGLMNSASSGTLTISGSGSLVIGASRELVVVANGRATAIDAPIVNHTSGPSTLTYSGGGTCSLSRANSYSGGTMIDAGTLVVSGAGTLGCGDVTVSGGTLWLSNGVNAVIGDTNVLSVADGANVLLAGGVNESVDTLFLGAVRATSGTWGASGSGAAHIDDVHLAGAGVLTVLSTAGDPTRVPRFSGELAFGEVATNTTAMRTVDLWNDGNQTLSVTGIQACACFSVTQQVFTVPSGGSVTLAVRFAPTGLSAYTGLLTLGCNATTGATSLAVSGTGVAPVPPAGMRTITALSAVIAIHVPTNAITLGVEDELAPGFVPVSISEGGTWDAANRKVKWFFSESGQVRDRALQYSVSGAGTVVTGLVNFGQENLPILGDTVFNGGGTPGLLHPADDNGDWRVTLQEVSASVARWKGGQDDIETPIVVRGITLYLQGEQYYYDPSVPAAAKRWSPVTVPLSKGSIVACASLSCAAFETLSSAPAAAVRSVAATNVTIAVTPEAGTHAWGLDESIPSGGQVAAISDSGAWDAVHRRIKWAFFDGGARTLSYSIEGPAGTNFALSGSVSFDGSQDDVTGESCVDVPLPFSIWSARQGLPGDPSAVFRVLNAEHSQPNGLVYAFQPSIKTAATFIAIGWEGGRPFIETPKQAPATLSCVDVWVESSTNIADTTWPFLLSPAADQSAAPPDRCRWTSPVMPNQAFFRIRAALK